MASFIARMIEKAADISAKDGKNKYKAYFKNTSVYAKYKEAVDNILINDGYEKTIV